MHATNMISCMPLIAWIEQLKYRCDYTDAANSIMQSRDCSYLELVLQCYFHNIFKSLVVDLQCERRIPLPNCCKAKASGGGRSLKIVDI